MRSAPWRFCASRAVAWRLSFVVAQWHRHGPDVGHPRMRILFEAGTHRWWKRRVGEGADSHAGPGWIGLSVVVNGRPALRAEVRRNQVTRRIGFDSIRA